MNLNRPDSDPCFNPATNVRSNIEAKLPLSVPIFIVRGEITCGTERRNRIDGIPFSDDDIKIIMAFIVFCGISFDIARLYKAGLKFSHCYGHLQIVWITPK
jgi:hypothetical protein